MRKTNVLSDIYPKSMKFKNDLIVHEFDNKFEYIASLKDNTDKYASKIDEFKRQVREGSNVDPDKVEEIRNTVRNNLIKRGIISGTVYEGFKYDVDGLIIDYAELASGNPECMLKPLKKYDKYFYELYVNMSIPWGVEEDTIDEGAIRMIETIKALEELNIEIKISVVMASERMYQDGKSYLCIIPICNHLEYKDYDLLFPYCNGDFLRGPMFQTMQSGEPVRENLGYAVKMKNTVNIWEIDEEKLADRVLRDLDMKGN